MLLKVLQRELVHKLRQFTPQGIENVLWAFATLGHHPGESPPPPSHSSPTTPRWESTSCCVLTFLLLWVKAAVQEPYVVVHCDL